MRHNQFKCGGPIILISNPFKFLYQNDSVRQAAW